MKVRIGSLEITDVTPEEFDELVHKYGQVSEGGFTTRKPSSQNGNVPADRVLLDRLVQVGSAGITTTQLGHLLGRQGKGVKPALDKWANRIKLVGEGDTTDPFERTRVGTQRGWRIKSAMIAVAKALLQE